MCSWKTSDGKPLVSKSATIMFVPICFWDIWSLWFLYLTIRNLILICFNFDKLLLLLEYKIVNLLSQNNFNDLSILFIIWSSMTKFTIISMVGCLLTCYKFSFHDGKGYECLLSILLENSSSSKQVDMTWSESITILEFCKIRVEIPNDL